MSFSLTSEFPTDFTQSQSLLLDLGITHFLSISPAKVPPCLPQVVHHHHITVGDSEEDLLLALPSTCAYIHKAVNAGGLVLVHSTTESRACIAACAYRKYSYFLVRPGGLINKNISDIFSTLFRGASSQVNSRRYDFALYSKNQDPRLRHEQSFPSLILLVPSSASWNYSTIAVVNQQPTVPRFL